MHLTTQEYIHLKMVPSYAKVDMYKVKLNYKNYIFCLTFALIYYLNIEKKSKSFSSFKIIVSYLI